MTSHDETAMTTIHKQGSGTDASFPRRAIPVLPGCHSVVSKFSSKARANSANNHGNTMSTPIVQNKTAYTSSKKPDFSPIPVPHVDQPGIHSAVTQE